MDLAAIRASFEENFQSRGELGAAVSVWHEGREVLSLAAGWRDRAKTLPWHEDTLVLMWSITKALASACLLHVLAADGIGLETPVAALWPEFAANGKAAITLAQLLSHQAGLSAMAAPQTSVLDHAAVAAALAAQAPVWPPGTAHGYGPRTFGFLVDELLRRLRPGHTVGTYWREQFAEPLGLDVWIGLPDEQADRVASIYPARSTGQGLVGAFYDALGDETSLTRRAFTGPAGLHAVASMNSPDARRASIPSFSGIGSARALGKFYAMLANGGVLDGRTFFLPHALRWMTTTLTSGPDRILCLDTAFSAGFMQDPVGADGRKTRQLYGPSTKTGLRPRGRRPRAGRPGKQRRLRLPDEPDGTRRAAQRQGAFPADGRLCGFVGRAHRLPRDDVRVTRKRRTDATCGRSVRTRQTMRPPYRMEDPPG